jgi:hypothetical protein
VVEAEPAVPHRVPDAFGDVLDVAPAAMQQHEVEVAVRRAVAASERTDRDEADVPLVAEQ